jgi:hypothetical protein
MGQYEWALNNVGLLDRYAIRSFAWNNFSLKAVVPQFLEYFRMIEDVRTGAGWYTPHNDSSIQMGALDFSALYVD